MFCENFNNISLVAFALLRPNNDDNIHSLQTDFKVVFGIWELKTSISGGSTTLLLLRSLYSLYT